MKRSEINQIVNIYDYLIKLGKKNLDKKVKMEWGSWYPTINSLGILESRRNRIKNGSLNAGQRLIDYFNNKEGA